MWRESWPTFSWVEGAATVAAGATTGLLALHTPPQDPRWQGGILFDDAMRRGLRLESASARQHVRSVGDWPYFTAPLLPLIIDPLVVSLIGRGDTKAAVNMELIGLEAFSYAGMLSFVSTRISVRERPDATECRRRHPDGAGCKADTESFWSGHTSIVAASAGLVCANHQYMRLWGSRAADVGACALAGTGALITAGSRVMADRHYTTDVLAGLVVGFGIGYGVPVLLHYRRNASPYRFAVQPDALGTGALLSVAGPF
jgi:membrane-associated phospholipid phosphatase